MTRTSFRPFTNESDVETIGRLGIENRTDRLVLSGDVELTCDRAGLAKAQALKGILDATVEELSRRDAAGHLPASIVIQEATPAGNLFGLPKP